MIDKQIYSERRQQVLDKLGNGVAILKGAPEQIRTHDTEFPYRQDSDFFYLTGYTDPGAACILNPNDKENPFTLLVLPKDPEKEVWTGWRLDLDETKERYQADQVLDVAEFDNQAVNVMKTTENVYTNLNHDQWHNYRMLDLLRKARREVQRNGGGPIALELVGQFTHEMRLLKSEHELGRMRRAAEISAEAHVLAMQGVQPGMFEYELQAIIEGHFLKQGASGVAYGSIVGSGDNATVLHYTTNRSKIAGGDLVLIDAGAEYEMYAADITRTFPANGTFSDIQKAIYDVVLNAQKSVIEAVKPGARIHDLHELDLKLLVEGLMELGLVKGSYEEIIEQESYKPYFMHKTGHWLGLDVHDVGRYRMMDQDRELEPGMVFTVEPGLYIGQRSDAPQEMKGNGIRIEDDILVTKDGCEILTSGVPKDVEEIESIMKS